MKNILYIGPYKENTGLGRSARRYVDAIGYNLDINLTIRPVYFTPHLDYGNEAGKDYTEFEENHFKSYDMVIQHGFPECFDYRPEYGENIGIVDIDTLNIQHTGWAERMNMMDRVLVGSNWSKKSALDAGCNTRIDVLPEPFDLSKFNKEYNPIFEDKDESFKFYFIGKHYDKNNIKALLAAFLLEFDKNDNVKLIIKTDLPDFDDQQSKQIITADTNAVEKSLRVQNSDVNQPSIIVGYYEQDYIFRLHQQCDCYVNVCKAESFGPSAIESMLFKNLTITNSGIGSNTYINKENGYVIDSFLNNVYSKDFYMENTYTIHEKWNEPYLDSIRENMRKAYEATDEEKEIKNNNFDPQLFSEESFIERLLA
jgi:glycosyltransferase involved in cell wall biosynthesis